MAQKILTQAEMQKRVEQTDLCIGCAAEIVCAVRIAVRQVEAVQGRCLYLAVTNCSQYRDDR